MLASSIGIAEVRVWILASLSFFRLSFSNNCIPVSCNFTCTCITVMIFLTFTLSFLDSNKWNSYIIHYHSQLFQFTKRYTCNLKQTHLCLYALHNHWPGCSGGGKGLVTIQLYYDLHLLATFEHKFVFKKLDGPQICGFLFPLFCLKFSLSAVQMTTNL